MINKITLVGNLGGDPETKVLENGTHVCRLSVATADNYKDKQGEWQKQTEWHSVTLWRELAERAGAYLKKGNLAKMVIASAARFTPVLHFCLNNKRIAEIRVPA